MRKKLHAWLVIFLLLSASPVFAAVAQPAAASAASGAAPTLTPEQARQALSVLNDPTRRAQVSDTLQAIAAAGALSAPHASAASAAAAASAPAAASSASALVPAAFQSNGLASQLARQGAHWAVHLGKSLRGSVAALLDVASV
ncbi:MAG: mechanosensitive ion channel protein, partial [Paraburkholderia nemoris]